MGTTKLNRNHKQFEDAIEHIIRYAQDIIADLPYKKKCQVMKRKC